MSSAAKQSAESVSQSAESPSRQRATAEEVLSSDAAVDAARVFAGGGDGLPTLNRFAAVQKHQTLLALQRTHGNSAVQRLLTRTVGGDGVVQAPRATSTAGAGSKATAVQRHASTELAEPENAIQRHTSVTLEEEENAIKRMAVQRTVAVIQRDLASQLSEAMSGWGTEEDDIYSALDAADATAKRAVLNNPALIAELRDELSGDELGKAMVKLGQPLADQIDYAIKGAGTDEDALFYAIESAATPDDQRRLVTRNPQLLIRLRDDLSQEDAGRAMRGLKASLTEQLMAAVEGAGTEEQQILDAIKVAPADQKTAALRDRALMVRLAEDLNTTEMIATLTALGSSLADRLNIAMDHWLGTDEDAIYAIAKGADANQKKEILGNSGLMARLRDELTYAEMMRVLTDLGGSLADMLDISLAAGESAKVLEFVKSADDTQKTRIRENSALVGRMQTTMSAEEYAKVCEAIGLPVPGQADAGDTGDAGTAAAGTEGDAGEAGAEAEPAEPTTLVGKISAALDKVPPDPGAAVAAVITADAAERGTVAEDTALRERLYAALNQAELLQVLAALGIGIASRLDTLITRNIPIADIQAHITAATPDEKRTVLDDRVLIERLVEYAGEAQRNALLIALGDTVGNQLDQVLADTPTLAALKTIIAAATEPQRQEIMANAGLLNRIDDALSAHEYFEVRIALLYGNDAARPAPVVALIAALAGSPTIATLRSPITNLAEADLVLVKTAVREHMRPKLSDADFTTLLRMLDQGLVVEETIDEDWKETLQADDESTAVVDFKPREFTGNTGFDVGYYRDRVQVTCRLQFSTPLLDSQAAADLPALMPRWEREIEAAWDSKYSLRNAQRTLPIRIDMVYNSGSPHHKVNVNSKTNPKWGEFNTGNWYPNATNFNMSNSIIHEFGHMMGNPDEYSLSAADYQTTVGTAAATDVASGTASSSSDAAGNQRFTHSSSVMGSPATGAGTVDPRHLNYFTNWLNRNRLPGEPAYTLI